MLSKAQLFAFTLLISHTLIASEAVLAGDLEFEPRINIAYNQSSNLALTLENEIEDSITEISPGFTLNYQGVRTLFNIDYQLQTLQYSKNEDLDEEFDQLNSTLRTELINDIFWLNFASNKQQQSISDTVDQPLNNIFSNNIADVSDTIIQPILRLRASGFTYQAIGNIARQRFDSEDDITQIDNDSSDYQLSITSDTEKRFNWSLSSFQSSTEFADSTENNIKNNELSLNYNISQQISFVALAGEDDNDFASNDDNFLSSDYWSSSLQWSPNRRFNFIASAGERFNASDNSLSIDYLGTNFNFNLTSEKELISNGFTDFDFDNTNLNNNTVANTINNDVFLRETNTLVINYNKRKLSIGLFFSEVNLDSQSSIVPEETNQNAEIDINWQIQSRTSIGLIAAKNIDEVPNQLTLINREDTINTQSITFNRQISANSEVTLLFRNQKRRSTDRTLDYNESGFRLDFTNRF